MFKIKNNLLFLSRLSNRAVFTHQNFLLSISPLRYLSRISCHSCAFFLSKQAKISTIHPYILIDSQVQVSERERKDHCTIGGRYKCFVIYS